MAGAEILMLIIGFVLGATTLGFVHGYRYCTSCWLALLNGRKYEDGCTSCILNLCNQYPRQVDETWED